MHKYDLAAVKKEQLVCKRLYFGRWSSLSETISVLSFWMMISVAIVGYILYKITLQSQALAEIVSPDTVKKTAVIAFVALCYIAMIAFGWSRAFREASGQNQENDNDKA